MKKIIILTMLLAFTAVSFGQQTAPNPNWKDSDLYKKSKSQKTAGWIMAGVGTAGFIVTLAADAEQAVNGGMTEVFSLGYAEPEYKSYTVPYLLSAAVVAGGVYLLYRSTRNKNRARAASVFIDLEKAQVLHGPAFSYQAFPVVGLRIRL